MAGKMLGWGWCVMKGVKWKPEQWSGCVHNKIKRQNVPILYDETRGTRWWIGTWWGDMSPFTMDVGDVNVRRHA